MTKNDKNDTKQEDLKVEQVDEVEALEKPEAKSKEQERAEELENQLKRALADYQNLEKRVREERGIWLQQANKGMLLRFLPAIDTLGLALKHSQDKGVAMAVSQILLALKEEGVEKIETEGLEFDPHKMECVQTVDGKENTVVQELRSGYTLYDKILRPAQVTVGKGE